MIKAIIPACGYGVRMGMLPGQSKEMLGDAETHTPIIFWSIHQCLMNEIEPLVLVRKEKEDLIDYLKDCEINHLIIEPGKEWAETVYNSKDHWNDKNILILPDTRWKPENALSQVKHSLEFGAEVVFAIHKVEDVTKWGYVDGSVYCEKPYLEGPGTAWGIIGFNKESGESLFKNMQTRAKYHRHQYDTNFIFLDEFKDITREKTVK